ncbi:hypothetical protein DPMN_157032 [Dreissena polymorpha]|uniref:Uncharacterized protein n=1 Tax=Dreissena polymorpha TaxID=45954 RepID=A0A9D4EF74_DREPO|nr:hypothetical protein DPMN_157032 [Dreissena polymorpha]
MPVALISGSRSSLVNHVTDGSYNRRRCVWVSLMILFPLGDEGCSALVQLTLDQVEPAR